MTQPQSPIARLLIPVDGSVCSEKAAQVGLELAALLGAEVRLLHVLDTDGEIEKDAGELAAALNQTREAAQARGSGILDRAVDLAHRLGVEVKTKLESGWPEQVILEQSTDCDLIVMGTHGRGGLERWVMGSVAEAVLATSVKPVLVVHERFSPNPYRPEAGTYRRLLIATDGSECGDRAVQQGARLAQALGAEVTLLHAVEPLPSRARPTVHLLEALGLLELDLKQQGQEVLERAQKQMGSGADAAQAKLVEGKPAHCILQEVPHHDLVVIGTHGRTGLDRLMLGSVAEQVVRQSAKPVLVIPSRCRPPKEPDERPDF